MNKKGTKKLSGALAATTVLTSVAGATPVFAKGTNWDAVYKTAYEAMQKAQANKTQESINAARKSINELAKNKKLFSMAATLSEKVDAVQEGLFQDLYAFMYVKGIEKETMTQDEINKAKALVIDFGTCPSNKPYVASWSSAIDKYQQANINKTTEAVKKADTSKKVEDVKAARALVNELLKASDENIKKAAKGLDEQLVKVEKETTKLAVEKVEAVNLKKIVVSFNKELNKETVNEKNVKLYNKEGKTQQIKLQVSDDNKNVYVMSDKTPLNQLQEYKLVVENVESKDGNKLAKVEKSVVVKDNVFPTVESVVATSPKTIKVVFSEPINGFPSKGQVVDSIQIDGVNTYLAEVDDSKNVSDNTVTITLATPLKEGKHKITLKGLKDFANLPVGEVTKEFELVGDSTMPAVTKVIANKNEIKVTFNKPVNKDSVNASNIKLYQGNDTPVKIKEINSKDNQTYTIKLENSLGLEALVKAKLSYKDVVDNYNNKVSKEQTVDFTAVDDKVKPEVKEIKVNKENKVEVTFSEQVEDVKEANFELLDKDGKKVDGAIEKVDKEENKQNQTVATVKFDANKVKNVASQYTLVIKDVKDASVRSNKLDEVKTAIVLNDTTAPNVVGKVIFKNSENEFTISFDEEMDISTLMNKSNYILSGIPLGNIENVTIKPAANKKSVTINIKDRKFADTDKITLIALKDIAGNNIESVGKEQQFESFTAQQDLENIIDLNKKCELVSKNTIKLYAKKGQIIKGIDTNKIKFNTKDANLVQVIGSSIESDGSAITLTLNRNLDADGTINGTAVQIVEIGEDAIVTTLGQTNKKYTTALNLEDKIPATLISCENDKTNTNKIVLTFDEEIQGSESAIVVKPNDTQKYGKKLASKDYSAKIQGKTIIIDVTKDGFKDKVTVELRDNIEIQDKKGNIVKDFSITTKNAVEGKKAQ